VHLEFSKSSQFSLQITFQIVRRTVNDAAELQVVLVNDQQEGHIISRFGSFPDVGQMKVWQALHPWICRRPTIRTLTRPLCSNDYSLVG